MPEEEKLKPGEKPVDIDTSGPEVDVTLEETKEEAVVDTAPETKEQETVERSQVASTCGLVLRMGPHCYDKERYPEGPWCKKGDWIIFARYAGSRIKIDGGEIRLLNDDEVLATVENPEDIFHEF